MIRFHGLTFCPSVTAELLVSTPWHEGPLGHAEGWSDALRNAVQLCLNSRFPMIVLWGPELIMLYNDAFLPILGERHPALLGRPAERMHPEMAAELGADARAALNQKESRLFTDRLLPVRSRGRLEEAYFTFSMSPVNDAGGQTVGVLSVGTETSGEVLQQRRGATVECLAEELAGHRALEPMSPAIRRVVATNRRDFGTAALFEVAADGTTGMAWCEPAEAAPELCVEPEVERYLAQLVGTGKRTSLDRVGERCFALTMVDEDVLQGAAYVLMVRPWELARIDASFEAFLRVVQGSMVGAVCRAFAERQALEAVNRRLDERDRLYRLLFERSHDGILICAPDGGIGAANPAACSLLRYSEAELRALGRAAFADDGALAASLEQRRRSGSFVGELEFRRKDGSVLTADVSSSVFRDEHAGEQRAVTLFRDATPRLLTERRAAATARLEAVGALTGGIAHDFNNLLNVIINGGEDLVERLPEGSGERAAADMVLSASVRAADLTRQLLAFSRQQPMAPCAVDTDGTLADLDQILCRTMGGGIDVEIVARPGVVALTDNSLLQSAILNLGINARDAMPDGGHLRIDNGTEEVGEALAEEIGVEPGRYVRIGVADTGVGIAEEHLGRIFEPFFTTKPVGRGTGLGLSMVFGFVRQSGGGMRVLSRAGEGTRVELYLPLAGPGLGPGCEGAAPQTNGACRTTGHVVVVEDETLLASMLERILEGAGHEVALFTSGEDALEALDAGVACDVLITDILLGSGMDGWSLKRQADRRRPGLPVITMSGFTPPEQGGQETPTLEKPFRPRQVLDLLDRAIGSSVLRPACR